MKLKFCFLTPEQEEAIKKAGKVYTDRDRDSLGLLVNGIYNLVHIMEIYALDNQGEMTEEQVLTTFQALGHLMEPVHEYFFETMGMSFKGKKEPETASA